MDEEETKQHGGKRVGAGRPANPETRRYARTINLNDREWARLQDKAKQAGLSISEYIRKREFLDEEEQPAPAETTKTKKKKGNTKGGIQNK